MAADTSALAEVALGATDSGVDSTVDSTPEVDTPVEGAVEGAPEEGAESEESEGKDTETHNADGSEKTPEEQKAFKDAADKASPLPTEVRSALKQLRDSNPDDPKIAKAVKELHGAYERYNALKPLLGTGGVNELKSLLSETGTKSIAEARAQLATSAEFRDTVQQSDELLYKADPKLAENVYEDMKANGSEKNYGKVVDNFLNSLRDVDENSFYEVTKPHMVAGLQEAGLDKALNAMWAALNSGDTTKLKSLLSSTGKWFNDLRGDVSEKGKISKERAAWEKERAEGAKGEAEKATKQYEESVATDCEKQNNTILGKSLGAYLKMPFFKGFPRETLVLLGNNIKQNLYESLKSDKGYQTQMSALWKAKSSPESQTKIVNYHKAKLESIADATVRNAVQRMYPNFAKGGSASGKAAASATAKASASKQATTSISTLRPIYVASRPENLVRSDVTVGGKQYTQSDLQTLQITGKGFVRTADGKGFKFVTWRK